MYSHLSYIPRRTLKCATSGYTFIIVHDNDNLAPEYNANGERLYNNVDVEVRDTDLAYAGGFQIDVTDTLNNMVAGNDDVVGITVWLEDSDEQPGVIMSAHLRSQTTLNHLIRLVEPFIPSSTPFRVFVIILAEHEWFTDAPTLIYDFVAGVFQQRCTVNGKLPNEHYTPDIIKSIIYRVPVDLTDFIKLPKLREYVNKMAMCAHALSRLLNNRDVISTVIVTSVLVYRERNYTLYCEHQPTKYWVFFTV